MAASNTPDAFRECVGKTIVGVLFDACPAHRADLKKGNKTFVFEDGTGFTVSSGGTFWQEPAEQISRAIDVIKHDLKTNERLLQDVLGAAGALA